MAKDELVSENILIVFMWNQSYCNKKVSLKLVEILQYEFLQFGINRKDWAITGEVVVWIENEATHKTGLEYDIVEDWQAFRSAFRWCSSSPTPIKQKQTKRLYSITA